jgi:hypothetical protein
VRESFLDPQSNNERVSLSPLTPLIPEQDVVAQEQGKQRRVQGWIKVIQV